MKTLLLPLALAVLLVFAAPAVTRADDDAGKIVDLSFEDAPLPEVLAELARLAGQNFILSPRVEGKTTVKFHMIAWKDALEAIAKANGLKVTYQEHGIVTIDAPSRPGAAGARKVQTVRLHDIRDLKSGAAGLKRDIAVLVAAGGSVEEKDGTLVVRASATQQEEFARAVARLRDREKSLHLVRGRLVTKNTTVKKKLHMRVDDQGRVISRWVDLESDPGAEDGENLARLAGTEERTSKIRAAEKRVADLRRAIAHLDAAGLRAEADRVRARAKEAETELQRAREMAAKARQVVSVHMDAPKDTQVATAVAGLRKEVHALRGEIRALTALVRKLLDER